MGPWMMGEYGWGAWGVLGISFMVIFWGLLIALLVVAIRALWVWGSKQKD